MTLIERDRRPIVYWLVLVLGALAVVGAVLRYMAGQHLERNAEHAALHYAQVMTAALPGLDSMLAHGGADGATLETLRSLRRAGGVFGFKLFDREGQLVLVSDDLDRPDSGLGRHGERLGDEHGARNRFVHDVVFAGFNHIALHEGGGQADRPALYSEAYVPILRLGTVIGVIQVDLDQTAQLMRVRQSYATVAIAVAAVLCGLGAYGAAQWRRRIGAQRRAEERVRYLAQHDVLSGALNRASLIDELQQAAWRAEANGPGFAVLCIDLDRFKEVNDTLGHAAGDDVLRQVAQRLRAVLRHGDVVARLGGDEFVILQSGVVGPADVTTLAQRVVEALAMPYDHLGRPVQCGGSVGAAIFGTDAKHPDELMQRADLALYRAKANGRGGFSFYEAGLDHQLQARRAIARDLREAIESNALSVHYQPLYASNGVTLTGYEALARWVHPQRGNVPPGEFIPVAEETGLIDALGRWVLRRACFEAATWPQALTVAVNLSAAQFRRGDLVSEVSSALAESALAPERLELEITESLLMSDTERVLQALRALSALGVRIAMDDFGTGYSSLAYLWRFPFDKVKIDRAFTKGLTEDPKVDLIVRSIVSLAHSLRIRVNAEGVETPAQMCALRAHGCDELQGFLLGRPAPAEALEHHNAVAQQPAPPEPPASNFLDLHTLPAAL